jgi:hypothetical protein
VLIELRTQEDPQWDRVGVFSADPLEIETLRRVLERHGNPIDALPHLPRGLLWDAIDSIRENGWMARVTFVEDN